MRTQQRHAQRLALGLAALGAGAWTAGRVARSLRPGYDFRGKVVLVTGGSRGHGLVLARLLADEAARLAICARDEAELERARLELEACGAEVLAHPCDLRDVHQVRDLVRRVTERYGHLDVLVNNAGIIEVGPLEAMTLEDFQDAMSTNYWGAVHATLEALPGMRARREGRIVNVSSIGGLVPVPHLLAYSASKFALTGFSQGLRAEVARDGIVVTTVCPSEMRTGGHRAVTFKGQVEKEYAWFSLDTALPFTSIGAGSAARWTLEACRRGDALAILGLNAKFFALAQALFPGITAGALDLMNRALPAPGAGPAREARGNEIEPHPAVEALGTLGERAARENNEPA